MSAEEYNYRMRARIVVHMRGEDGVSLGGKKIYEKVFKLTSAGAKMPWYVLRNFYAPAYVKKELGDEGVKWDKIVEAKVLKLWKVGEPNSIENIPLRVMTYEQLERYVEKKELMVKPREYHSIEQARYYVALCEEDPIAWQAQHKEYVQGKKRSYPELDGVRKAVETEVDNLLAKDDEEETEAPKKKTEVISDPTPVQKSKKRGAKGKKKKSKEEKPQVQVEEFPVQAQVEEFPVQVEEKPSVQESPVQETPFNFV